MNENERLASLLPYLDAGRGPSRLKLSLRSTDPSVLGRNPFPFVILNDADPLGRLIEAAFVTDSGEVLRNVFLLAQKDHYALRGDELWPLTNIDVENAWQSAFSFYARAERGRFITVLAHQTGQGGRFVQLLPLFFCTKRELFFHPPCPKCGASLLQCTSDDLLASEGLQPYSRSLKRYLYCQSCVVQDIPDFYIYELDHLDPPRLKDRTVLIRELSGLRGSDHPVTRFPCGTCAERTDCFGAGLVALRRMLPLAFYPFYMFIFESASLHALDLLPLLSGATAADVEERLQKKGELGRLNCLKSLHQSGAVETPFLFEHDARHFLEILYLKLTFLDEMVRLCPSGEPFRHPALRPSLDGLWIRLADQSSLLPSFWSFKVLPMEVSRPLSESGLSKGDSTSAPHFLGLAWFHTLLVNKVQDIAKVYLSLKGALARSGSSGDGSPLARSSENDTCFLPANIFWDPDGKEVAPEVQTLWETSLQLGWSLLTAGSGGSGGIWMREAFCARLQGLREEVRAVLFGQVPALPQEHYPTQQVQRPDEKAVLAALQKILDKWRIAAGGEERKGPPEDKEELAETVILSPQDLNKDSLLNEQPAAGEQTGEIMPETIITALPGAATSPAGNGPTDPGQEIDAVKAAKPEEVEFMAETVILTPPDKEKRGRK